MPRRVVSMTSLATTMWTPIYRHPNHEVGVWQHDRPLYESAEAAADAAHAEWDGTDIAWRIMSIPGRSETWP